MGGYTSSSTDIYAKSYIFSCTGLNSNVVVVNYRDDNYTYNNTYYYNTSSNIIMAGIPVKISNTSLTIYNTVYTNNEIQLLYQGGIIRQTNPTGNILVYPNIYPVCIAKESGSIGNKLQFYVPAVT